MSYNELKPKGEFNSFSLLLREDKVIVRFTAIKEGEETYHFLEHPRKGFFKKVEKDGKLIINENVEIIPFAENRLKDLDDLRDCLRNSFVWKAFYKGQKLYETDLTQFSFEDILEEETYDFKQDINYLWDLFKYLIDLYKHDPDIIYQSVNKNNYFVFNKISSEDLPSELAEEANKNKKIDIYLGVFKNGSDYFPIKKQLFISLNFEMIKLMKSQGHDFIKNIDPTIKKLIDKDFSYNRLSATIAHELSHWLNDALRNSHLEKYIQKLPKYDVNKQNEKMLLSYIEIEGYIHTIKYLKKSYTNKEWNNLTFPEFIKQNNSLLSLFEKIKKIKDTKEKQKWKKRFIKRMMREDLLGDNMKMEDLKL